MSHPPEQRKYVTSFGVKYMGTAIIPQTSTGLKTLQKPLKDLYNAYQLPSGPLRLTENLLTITDAGVIVSRILVGEMGDYATGEEVIYEVSSIQFWDAVQFVTVREKQKKYRFAFEPLNNDHSRNKDNLFSVLDFKHEKHLTNVPEHPVLFVITVCRKSRLKVVDLHAFICTSDYQANNIITHMNTVNLTFGTEGNQRSTVSKKTLFGRKSSVAPSPGNVSMNSNGFTNSMPHTKAIGSSTPHEVVMDKPKKKKWGLSRKSSLSRSVSVPDMNVTELSIAQPRQSRYELSKGDFIHVRESKDTRFSQGNIGRDNQSGYQQRPDYQNNFALNQSSYNIHHSGLDMKPHEEHFYQNGKQNSSSDNLERSRRLGGNEMTQSVMRLDQPPRVSTPSTTQNEPFMNMRSLGAGKTYRVYENTSRDTKPSDNIVCEKFRRFGETSSTFDNQMYERNFERGRGRETEISPAKKLNEASSANKIPLLPGVPLYLNTKPSGNNVQRGHERSSMSRIGSDSMPLSLLNSSQSSPPANNLIRAGNISPSYRRKFPTTKAADKTNQLLPSPILRNNKPSSFIGEAHSINPNSVKTTPQRPDCDVLDPKTQPTTISSEHVRLDHTREHDIPKKKPIPTPRRSIVEKRPSPAIGHPDNETVVISPESPREVTNKPTAFVQPRKVMGVRVLPFGVEDINTRLHKSRSSKADYDPRQSTTIGLKGSYFKDHQVVSSTEENVRDDGTFFTRTNLETSLGYLP